MDPTLAGLLGAAIGALASLFGSLFTTWLLIRKEREQWALEKKNEREIWLRDRLQEIYTNSIEALYKITRRSEIIAQAGTVSTVLSQEHQRELFNDYSDAKKWLSLLLIYHPNLMQGNYKEFASTFAQFTTSELPDLNLATYLRSLVIAMASIDNRIQMNRET